MPYKQHDGMFEDLKMKSSESQIIFGKLFTCPLKKATVVNKNFLSMRGQIPFQKASLLGKIMKIMRN